MNDISADRQKIFVMRNQIIENKIAALIPIPLIKWLVKRSMGVPPLGTYRVIMEKYTRLLGMSNLTLNDYIETINTHSEIFGYQVTQHIEKSPIPGNVRILFESEDFDHLKGIVANYSCLLAHHPLKLKTRNVVESPGLYIIDYEQCSSESEAYESVQNHFGTGQFFMDEIHDNSEVWKNVINVIKADNYDDLIINREIFLQILNSHDFSDQLCSLISNVYKVFVEEVDYRDITRFIKEICTTIGLMYNMEHDPNEIKIYHKINDINVIRSINDTVIKTLEITDHHFIVKKEDKTTILTRN